MVQEVVSGDALRLGDSLLEVVWPTDTSLSEPGNDSSVVVTLTPLEGCASCLSGIFLGDLGDIPQRILAGRETLGGVDVVKVSHHGSSDQYAGLYEELGAQAGLIGVGAENTYGHPTDRALGMLENLGVTTLRSDQRGTVTLGKNAAGALVMWSEREQPAG
jgi:competence protein ComEC